MAFYLPETTPYLLWTEGFLATRTSAVTDETTLLKTARREALAIVGGQFGITLLVALASGYLGGSVAAWSALAGGGIGTLAGLYMALTVFFRRQETEPARIARRFYRGEFGKLALTAVLFGLVLGLGEPRFGPMLAGYVATFIAYWIALVRGFDPTNRQEV